MTGTMFAYQLNGETVSALHKFKEGRIGDSIARSLKSRIGCQVDVWYSYRGESCDVYTAKWFDGDVFCEATIAVTEIC